MNLRELLGRFTGSGRLEAILLRSARGEPAVAVERAEALAGRGLEGDRSARAGRSGGRRQITLIQAEHLPLIAAWTGRERLDPAILRRNLVIGGINLLSGRSPLRELEVELHIGESVVLAITGACDPCSKMERELGHGACNAMRGHGGLTARVLVGGPLTVGDPVRLTTTEPFHAEA